MKAKILAGLLIFGISICFSGALAADWYPSKWGQDDEIGAANLLSPVLVLKAAKLITTGKVYRMGVPVDRTTPAFAPRSLAVTVLQPNQYAGASFAENKMSYNDDIFNGWLGIGTQIDSLAHLGIEAGPFPNPNRVWEGHQVLLAKNGIYILETLDTREMVKDGVKEFLFVLGQPLYTGAVQAIINPVGIR